MMGDGGRAGDGEIRVLVVDDEPDVADLAGDYLEHADASITTVTANGPEDGLATLDADRVDCVVSDFHMPEMDGLEFRRAARERAPVPFILFTSDHGEGVETRADEADVAAFFRKGTDAERYERLASAIREAVP